MSLFATKHALVDPIMLLDSVYGSVDNPEFPLPMVPDEAGLCADGKQRRYLWTDAFGVLAYTSIADHYESEGNDIEAEKYHQAANVLIDVVHRCLGSPRSGKDDDAMSLDASSPTGFVGLRIGKVLSKKNTDFGMVYDGMYFHYIDKWLLALARSNRVEDAIKIAKSCFPFFFDAGPDGNGQFGGIRWKLSTNASPPRRAFSNVRDVSDDTLNALIVFSILEAYRKSEDEESSLQNEIKMLKRSLHGYLPQVSAYDPLGWGLEAMYDQFIEGQPRWDELATTHPNVLDEAHLLSLPFRLYGAMIGARVAGENVAPTDKVDTLIQESKSREIEAMSRGTKEEHSSINRVMLAMCMLCPGALGRRSGDPLITLE
jgi:hypothetical protein